MKFEEFFVAMIGKNNPEILSDDLFKLLQKFLQSAASLIFLYRNVFPDPFDPIITAVGISSVYLLERYFRDAVIKISKFVFPSAVNCEEAKLYIFSSKASRSVS